MLHTGVHFLPSPIIVKKEREFDSPKCHGKRERGEEKDEGGAEKNSEKVVEVKDRNVRQASSHKVLSQRILELSIKKDKISNHENVKSDGSWEVNSLFCLKLRMSCHDV